MIDNLRRFIRDEYGFKELQLTVHREMIGTIFLLEVDEKRYVLKQYKEVYTEEAIRSIDIMCFLNNNNAPVPKVLYTKTQKPYVVYRNKVIVIFEYVEGKDVCFAEHEKGIISSLDKIQKVMSKYPKELPKRDYWFYVLRYIEYLESIHYSKEKVNRLEYYGKYFYDRISDGDFAFCHGDLHTGNMIYTKDNKIIIYDFDTAGMFNPLIDSVTLIDSSNFNDFQKSDILNTYTMLKKRDTFSQDEILKMIAFIPLRHYELIATIILNKGDSHISSGFHDQQYDWIQRFYRYYTSNYCE